MARNGQFYVLALKSGHYGLIHGPIPPSRVTDRRSPQDISNRSQVGVKTFVLELLAVKALKETKAAGLADKSGRVLAMPGGPRRDALCRGSRES